MSNEEQRDPRDIDGEIAERVLGWHREKTPPDANGEHGGTDILIQPDQTIGTLYTMGIQLPPKGAIHLAWFVPQYSLRIDQALALLKCFAPPKYYTRIVLTSTRKWRCDIELRGGDGPVCSAAHESLPMAISLCVIEVGKKGIQL